VTHNGHRVTNKGRKFEDFGSNPECDSIFVKNAIKRGFKKP